MSLYSVFMDRATKSPTTIVIFGATGDLARRKLLPSLWHLFRANLLPAEVSVVGMSRDDMSDDDYRKFVHQVVPEASEQFLQALHFQPGEFSENETYKKLATELAQLDEKSFSVCSNKLFYLAVPPTTYDVIFENLAKSGLSIPCQSGKDGEEVGWTRVLVEKPFGRDLETAQELDQKLAKLFQEEQIFRIDHYLAKETVQNIITFRFGNALFEPVWDSGNVHSIKITLHEKLGVGERASFYEGVGALRDVGQNHLLQLLALTTMEDPGSLDPHAIRSARSILLQNLMPLKPSALKTKVVRGQYADYRQMTDVDNATETETFFRLQMEIANKRWQGVPITLEAGKKMAEDKVEIEIAFKEPVSCVCPLEDQHHQNVLTIRVQPNEGIKLRFWVKKPGLGYEMEPRDLSFSYQEDETDIVMPDAYQKVLYDCIRGDQTLFASTDEVAASWAFITPILENWSQVPLQQYEPNSTGPLS